MFPIKVSIWTVLVVGLSFLAGYYRYLFIHYLLAFIHEIFHVVTALFFRTKVSGLTFLPFGFYAEFADFEDRKPYQQLLILAAGPASYFFSALLLRLFYVCGAFSLYTYRAAMSSNLVIALFNLIPFYPLDGARIAEVLIARFFSEYKTRIIRLSVSFVSLVGLSILCIRQHQIPIIIYLALNFLIELALLRKKYLAFLMRRLFDRQQRPPKFTFRDEVFRYHQTYKVTPDGVEEEQSIVARLIGRFSRRRHR